ncbi:hypothetical protein Save01_02425 [Streptomyces avermitilis]|uniref:Uncharacterized protein n=1 Tax=Streptomyces avermitilis TaxID=33903 RepID=A0A4D4MAA8_STRAX|nr:hypothetical protein SAV14893_078000 [Streptomyces avermitilis]
MRPVLVADGYRQGGLLRTGVIYGVAPHGRDVRDRDRHGAEGGSVGSRAPVHATTRRAQLVRRRAAAGQRDDHPDRSLLGKIAGEVAKAGVEGAACA